MVIPDAEVTDEPQKAPAFRVAPLLIEIGQEAVNLGDFQINLLAGEGGSFGGRDGLLPAESLGCAPSQQQRCENGDFHTVGFFCHDCTSIAQPLIPANIAPAQKAFLTCVSSIAFSCSPSATTALPRRRTDTAAFSRSYS